MSDEQLRIDRMRENAARLCRRGMRRVWLFLMLGVALCFGGFALESLGFVSMDSWSIVFAVGFLGVAVPSMIWGIVLVSRGSQLGEEAHQLSLTPEEIAEQERPRTVREVRETWVRTSRLFTVSGVMLLFVGVGLPLLSQSPRAWVVTVGAIGFALYSNAQFHFVMYREWREARRREQDSSSPERP